MGILNDFYTLSNGKKIPKIGLGTWQVEDGDETYNSVLLALKNGYRHIDTAQGYQNEASVGKAVKDSGLKREEIFITSKLEAHIKDSETAVKAIESSLEKLGYIDLFLIHAPWPWSNMGQDCKEGNIEVYKVMEEYHKKGLLKTIGVSNFNKEDLLNIMDNCEIKPEVNQIGYFIGIDQKDTIDFCNKHNILIEAYSPLGIGYLLANEDIQKIAKKYNKTTAQICIRYCIEKNTLPLPKTTKEHRMIENSSIDFKINKEDMDFLDTIKGDPRRWD